MISPWHIEINTIDVADRGKKESSPKYIDNQESLSPLAHKLRQAGLNINQLVEIGLSPPPTRELNEKILHQSESRPTIFEGHTSMHIRGSGSFSHLYIFDQKHRARNSNATTSMNKNRSASQLVSIEKYERGNVIPNDTPKHKRSKQVPVGAVRNFIRWQMKQAIRGQHLQQLGCRAYGADNGVHRPKLRIRKNKHQLSQVVNSSVNFHDSIDQRRLEFRVPGVKITKSINESTQPKKKKKKKNDSEACKVIINGRARDSVGDEEGRGGSANCIKTLQCSVQSSLISKDNENEPECYHASVLDQLCVNTRSSAIGTCQKKNIKTESELKRKKLMTKQRRRASHRRKPSVQQHSTSTNTTNINIRIGTNSRRGCEITNEHDNRQAADNDNDRQSTGYKLPLLGKVISKDLVEKVETSFEGTSIAQQRRSSKKKNAKAHTRRNRARRKSERVEELKQSYRNSGKPPTFLMFQNPRLARVLGKVDVEMVD